MEREGREEGGSVGDELSDDLRRVKQKKEKTKEGEGDRPESEDRSGGGVEGERREVEGEGGKRRERRKEEKKERKGLKGGGRAGCQGKRKSVEERECQIHNGQERWRREGGKKGRAEGVVGEGVSYGESKDQEREMREVI